MALKQRLNWGELEDWLKSWRMGIKMKGIKLPAGMLMEIMEFLVIVSCFYSIWIVLRQY